MLISEVCTCTEQHSALSTRVLRTQLEVDTATLAFLVPFCSDAEVIVLHKY